MSNDRSATTRRALMRLMRDSLPGHLGKLGIATVCIVIVAVATSGVAWLMKDAVNTALGSHDSVALWVLPAAILLVSAVKGIADYIQSVLTAQVGNAVSADFQERLFRKLLGFEQRFFDTGHSGRIAAQIIANTRGAKNVFITLTTNIGRDALTVAALTFVMALHDPVLALLIAAISPVVMLGLSAIGRKVKGLAHAELEGGTMMQSVAQEAFQGIRTVRAFGLEERMGEQFGKSVHAMRRRSDALVRLSALTSPLGEIVGGLMIAATILVAGWGDNRSPGEVMSFVTAFLLAFQPAKRLMNAHVALLRGGAAVARVYQTLDRPEPELPTPAVQLERTRGELAFRGVSFGYDKKRVLADVSFEANPGETVALIGRSGVGKTTIFALLQGLYRPQSGTVELDGIDITRLAPNELRRHFSIVSQSTTLFSTSIGENIRMARPAASDAEVEAAAAAAGALEFITGFPRGFDTQVGEQGMTLSGGQVQRISMARAILRDAPILLLDEATAALDAETAEQVQSNLLRLNQARTTLVIAHRPAMISAADRVVILADGKVVDRGTPSELLLRSRAYRSLIGSEPHPLSAFASPDGGN